MEFSRLISQLRSEEKVLHTKIFQIRRAISKLQRLGRPTGRRTFSAEARRRIAAAQKKRWAKWKRNRKK